MSKIDWEQKLKQYHALKDRKSITNMLQIKTKIIRLSPSLGSSTRAGTERNSFRHRRLKTPIDDGIQLIKTSKSQQIIEEVSPLKDVCPWNTQTPLQKFMKIDKATDKEKKVLQQFICNKWLKEVILKKSIHVAIPKESEEEKRIRLQEFETSEHHRQLRIQQSLTPCMSKMEKVFCKIKIFCKLASQRGIPLSDQIRINNDYRRLVFFVHFRNEDYKICDQMINSDPQIKNAIDMQGDRPLHIAVRRNNLRQLTYILSKQPDLEAINFYEQTALNLAILLKHFEIQKILLVYGCSPWKIFKPNKLVRTAILYRMRMICEHTQLYDELAYCLNIIN